MERGNGAPGENRTPNLMVRSHALYPIELRAHSGDFAFASSHYNAILFAKRVLDADAGDPLSRIEIVRQDPDGSAFGCGGNNERVQNPIFDSSSISTASERSAGVVSTHHVA